jgi:hypothetical protein
MRFALLVLLCACGKHAFDPCDPVFDAPPTSGLVAHFAFDTDGLLVDRANDHVANCPQCPLLVGGRVGDGAASFSSTSCIIVTDAFDLRPTTFTFAAWVAPVGPMTRKTAVSRPYMNANNPNTFALYVESNNNAAVEVNGQPMRAGNITTWHHIAGTFDSNMLVFYLDGVIAGGPMAVGAAPYASDDLRIGCESSTSGETAHFSGTIDDVRFYDRVLDATEIAALAAM